MPGLRRKSSLKGAADQKVFVDLGSLILPEDDGRRKVRVIEPDSEGDLGPVSDCLSSGTSVIVNLSHYIGDMEMVEGIMHGAVEAVGGFIVRIDSDVWFLATRGIMVEMDRR